ncbi:MAG TPA: type I-E CRISPR-associated protein Cas6/Cse3/CasE [Ottowia sp.]|uniref:type I-E CRISPR-associated protein Cas6/Cse3/CasE n=1 Tax=Ottowia sp. TaxID=1898956 RepID=UPI002B800431|nr:type I-E CRISPR-associated protein Cas6/Cse3/CasE [Ottowia sp.]HMN22335.1 type I-E CRISPR-associated protein Cas6/Cse3/CasE [Ottowia sp.]
MSAASLYLLHTQPDQRLLSTWMVRHRTGDLGDALHGLLRAAFGAQAPQPFRYLDERRGLLAYTHLDAQAMATQVALADPLAAQTLGLAACSNHGGYRLRPFPTQWPQDKELGFEVRVRPTVRSGQKEQDAFLHAVALAGGADGAPVDRQAVYAQWLREHLAVREGAPRQPWQGAVQLLDMQLSAFARNRAMRRTQPAGDSTRKGHAIEGPDAILSGRLRVTDPTAFSHLLARGVGRHRAYGFGMLLLQRAD